MVSPPGAGISGKVSPPGPGAGSSVPLFEKSNSVPLSKVPAPGAKVSLADSASTGPDATGAGSTTGGPPSCLMLLAVVARST